MHWLALDDESKPGGLDRKAKLRAWPFVPSESVRRECASIAGFNHAPECAALEMTDEGWMLYVCYQVDRNVVIVETSVPLAWNQARNLGEELMVRWLGLDICRGV